MTEFRRMIFTVDELENGFVASAEVRCQRTYKSHSFPKVYCADEAALAEEFSEKIVAAKQVTLAEEADF